MVVEGKQRLKHGHPREHMWSEKHRTKNQALSSGGSIIEARLENDQRRTWTVWQEWHH